MHRVDIYIPAFSVTIANESMRDITRDVVDKGTFARSKTLGSAIYYGVSVVLSDSQFDDFLVKQFSPGVRWFEGDSRLRIDERLLQSTNTDARRGKRWTIENSELQVSASPQSDWINKHLYWDRWVTRRSNYTWEQADIPTPALDINTPGVRLINCIIHDFGLLGLWSGATGAEMYGCIVYNMGISAPDRGHGHSLYTQNRAGTTKTIKHNIFFNSFGWGIHAYANSGQAVQDFDIIENTCFNAGKLYADGYRNILIGADRDLSANIKLIGNMTYGAATGLQFYGAGAEHVTLENNYCPDGVTGKYAVDRESGNYWGPNVGNQVFLYPNAYDPRRANLVIYNEAQADTIEVDVSAIYANGTQVQARNVQDYFRDILTLEVIDGVIEIPMTGHTVAAPVGWTAPATTFPLFGCFVLQA